MKCVCMFLSASGDVEVELQGPRKLGEPTRSASEKVRFFPKRTAGEYFFFLFTFVTNRQTLSRTVFSENKLFSPPPALFFLVTILHGRLRDGPFGLWEPSPLLGSALVGANKMGPCLQICRYMEGEGGGGGVGGGDDVRVCVCVGGGHTL